MNHLLNYIKKNWIGLALVAIIIVAFFVRFYKFDEWLYFKMDQSRDALLISRAVENGPGYLPLLGARAGAVALKNGFLRLGPAFYYFEYLSGKIFNSTDPDVFAYPDLFFSLLAIGLLYFLARLYFSPRNSLFIAAMYAFSFIIIQYSRFSWNPNALQFFLLLTFYGLLRMLNESREKWRKWWVAVWAIGAVIGSQLHFFGFFSLVGISGLLIVFHLQLWKIAKIKACFKLDVLKKFAVYVVTFGIVFLTLYAPVIISETKNNFQNSKNFIEALTAKPANKPFLEKIQKDVEESVKYYCLITTSQCYGSSLKDELLAIFVTGLTLLSGLIFIIRKLRKKINPLRRDFLMLLLVWVGVFSILTIPVSFQLRPRFFIVVFATPFLFLGLIFECIEEKLNKKTALILSCAITLSIIAWNSNGTYEWFKEQEKSQRSSFNAKRTLILKNKDGVTLGQLERATDWIYARHKNEKTLYYYVKPEHVRPINYLLVKKQDEGLKFSTMKKTEDPQAQFFAITTVKSGLNTFNKKFGSDAIVLASEKIGQLMVFEVDFPNRKINSAFKFSKEEDGEDDRLYWKDIFSNKK